MILLNGNNINENMDENILNNGFCIYEVIRIFKGHPIFLQDNLERLANSITQTHFPYQLDEEKFRKQLASYIAITHTEEGNIKYALLQHSTGQVDEYFYRIAHSYPSNHQYTNGVATITMKAIRENPNIKYINHSLRNRSNQLLHKSGAYEAIMINAQGEITEGSRSNIFFIKDDTLYTAPLQQVLPGTGRKRVMDLCLKADIEVIQQPIKLDSIAQFDAAFITGTSPLVLPIKNIDRCNFNVNNQVLRKVMKIYFDYISYQN